MKFLYTRLAAQSIRKNARTYIPFILTCACMVSVFYITSFLSTSDYIVGMRGGDTLSIMLSLGTGIMVVFSAIFLFYTNSFLIRRRNRELGLYNILGMGKRSIAAILLRESAMVYALSMAAGLAAGILFSKLAELCAAKLLGAEIPYGFSVSPDAVVGALTWYAVIFVMILLNTLRKIHFSDPIALMKSESEGERPPKTNVPAAVTGLLLLSGAYALALGIKDPLGALLLFFIAVIMVIIATYLLFMAGSVVMCRIMKRSKGYYYKTPHFVSVSQMAYRMRKNGAGLASICILSTMVLVTVSTTTCLMIGEEDTLASRSPRGFNFEFRYTGERDEDKITQFFESTLAEDGMTPENLMVYRMLRISGVTDGGGVFQLAPDRYSDSVCSLYIIPAEYCGILTGTPASVGDGQAVIADSLGLMKGAASVTLEDFPPLEIVGRIENFVGIGDDVATIYPSAYIFVTDDAFNEIYEYQSRLYGENSSERRFGYNFDLSLAEQQQEDEYFAIREKIHNSGLMADDGFTLGFSSSCKECSRSDFYAMYGGLFMLGIMLGGVFTLSAVLIMYYKQITEGFEDRRRFSILQKVGMTDREVRRSINSQVLTVFFLPLAAAGMHTAFAFPMISRIMATVFGLGNKSLLLWVTLGCFAVFAALYAVIYKLTSRSYYGIVSGGRKER